MPEFLRKECKHLRQIECQNICQFDGKTRDRTHIRRKLDHMSQHMSDFTAVKMSELMPTRTSEHSPEHVPALMIDDVSKHIPDLMAEQASEHCFNPHVKPRLSALSVNIICPAFSSKSQLGVGITRSQVCACFVWSMVAKDRLTNGPHALNTD